MAPRKRSDRYDHLKLPEHVEVVPTKDAAGNTVLYYQYRTPSGARESLGKDLKSAKAAANVLNQQFYGDDQVLERLMQKIESKAMSNNPIVPVVTREFEEQWLPKQEYSRRSLSERIQKLRQYDREWPQADIQSVSTFHLNRFLRTRTQEAQRQHLPLMRQLFAFAASAGYITNNPTLSLLRVKQPPRKRQRHTWAGYCSTKAAADPWLSRAMDAAFYTLQRRSDLVSLMIPDHINLEAGTIQVEQQKSGSLIRIAMGKELRTVVRDSYGDGIVCPYLVRCRPKRSTAATRKSKPHPFAVLPDYLSRAHKAARDRSGAYDSIPAAERPTFHDIRALGVWAYFRAGYSVDYIMALAGHADSRMTFHYEEGHEKPKPMDVEAGLSIANVDFTNIDWQTDLPQSLSDLIDRDD